MMLHISSSFDGGNIQIVEASDPDNIRLTIRRDTQSHFYQWFYFRIVAPSGTDLTLHIENAAQAAYPGGSENYQAVQSHDLISWTRIPTRYEKGVLTLSANAGNGSVYLAYFAPYTEDRHRGLIARASQIPGAHIYVLGQTLDGRDLDLISFASASSDERPQFWLTARQHPGETMAEWWMEGFLERLACRTDEQVRQLLESVGLHIVPNMNPDGSARGHLRTNAAGVNLNREWQSPSPDKSPEVYLVLEKMRQTGLDFALDVHGDETLPYNFIAGTQGIPNWSDRLAGHLEAFQNSYVIASDGAFQTAVGYPVNAPGQANLTICSNALAAEFDCLAMTLEMPFKDDANHPDPKFGWSPERARKLGADSVGPLLDHARRLAG